MDGYDMMGDDEAGEDFSGDDWSGDDWSGDDWSGDDVLGDDVLGAAARRYQAARGRRGGQGRRRPMPVRRGQQRRAMPQQYRGGGPAAMGRPISSPAPWRQAQLAPGVQAPTEQMLIVGFVPEDGVPTFLPAGITQKSFLSRPQKPFRGERLIITLLRSAGAATVPVNVTQLLVGSDNQIVGFGPIPAETFSGTFFGVRLAMSASQPGVELRVVFNLGAAVPAGESIGVQVTQIGRAVL